jgi:hypothetical protein
MKDNLQLVNHEEVSVCVVIRHEAEALFHVLGAGSFQILQIIGMVHHTLAIGVFIVDTTFKLTLDRLPFLRFHSMHSFTGLFAKREP